MCCVCARYRYGCVAADGASFSDQLLLSAGDGRGACDERTRAGLRQVAEAVHAGGAAACMQLTHGAYSRLVLRLACGAVSAACCVFYTCRECNSCCAASCLAKYVHSAARGGLDLRISK